MAKYIDAERLRATIKKRINSIESCPFIEAEFGAEEKREGEIQAYNDVLAFIDSLQQEQQEEPDKGLDVTDFCKPIDPGIAQCVADHWWELLGDKEPDKSLEEAADEWYEKCPAPKSTWWDEGEEMKLTDSKETFIAGAEWQKEQILKDAVEADVNTYEDLVAGKSWAEFVVRMPTSNLGDKVRIVVLKAEEE